MLRKCRPSSLNLNGYFPEPISVVFPKSQSQSLFTTQFHQSRITIEINCALRDCGFTPQLASGDIVYSSYFFLQMRTRPLGVGIVFALKPLRDILYPSRVTSQPSTCRLVYQKQAVCVSAYGNTHVKRTIAVFPEE